MKTDKISVIIPVYNIEHFILPCLESVAAQTYKNLEIVVVDDGSTDGTSELVDIFAENDDRFRVIHKKNEGVTSARVCGALEAEGDWIGFVDGDDVIDPDMYERLLANAHTYKADISHCGYQMVFPNRVDYYYNTGCLVRQDSQGSLQELLGGAYEPSLCNKIFRKSLINSLLHCQKIDPNVRINEDLLMNFYLFRDAEQIVFEDFCPYHYLVHKGSAANTKKTIHHLQDPTKVHTILLREVQGNDALTALCLENLVRHRIRVATMRRDGLDSEIAAYVVKEMCELRSQLRRLFRNGRISTMLKCQALWAAYAPATYRGVHRLYGELRGTAHKYDLE